MTDMNSQAKMVFDIALANEWYAVVPAVFKGNLKDVLIEKYIRTLIQECPEKFSEECIADQEDTQWNAVGHRISSMKSLSYMLSTLKKHRAAALEEAQEAPGGESKTVKQYDDILQDIRKHCDRQLTKIDNPAHQYLVQEVIDKIYGDARSPTAPS